MNTQKLLNQYPWYEEHVNAVNTTARYSGVDVEEVLKTLDSKITSTPGFDEFTQIAGQTI